MIAKVICGLGFRVGSSLLCYHCVCSLPTPFAWCYQEVVVRIIVHMTLFLLGVMNILAFSR